MQARLQGAFLGAALATGLLAAGCFSGAPPPPPSSPLAYHPTVVRNVTHTVRSGETIYHIARIYGVSTRRLMEANGITDAYNLRVGQTLRIPLTHQPAELAGAGPWDVPRASRQFSWPVSPGVVSSGFGPRNGTMHEGVDIDAPVGTPVHAADDGVVIFSGPMRGYGNVVIIRHSGDYATVYGHNKVNLVREGQHVVRSQVIGEVGTTGRTTGPNLHFEVRRNNIAQNPLAYLPVSSDGISFASTGGS